MIKSDHFWYTLYAKIFLHIGKAAGTTRAMVATALFISISAPDAFAIVWPDEAGYGGNPYDLWIYDGTNLELSAQSDIIQVDVARDTASTNNFFFFRFLVRDQQNSQLTSVSHVAFIDTDGDGYFEYVLYNPTTGSNPSDLHYWDTNSVPNKWSNTPSPPAQEYTTYNRDISNADNFIEMALPADDIGDPIVLLQGAASDQGALNMNGNTNNAPSLTDFADITETAVTEPTTDASNIVFTTVGTTNLSFSWSAGNGANHLIVMSTNVISWVPIDNTDYTAASNYTNAQEVTNGVRVIYDGSQTNTSTIGLSTGTTYYVKVFEYNGTTGTKNYYTSGTPATASQQTIQPTLVVLSGFRAFRRDGKTIITWQTAAELGSVGFHLERQIDGTNIFTRVNSELIPALLGGLRINTYELEDPEAPTTGTCTYQLIEIENTGKQNTYGPFTVELGGPNVIDLMEWLTFYFKDPVWGTDVVEATIADPDGDGLSNLEEFLAATDPTDAQSLLKMLTSRLVGQSVIIEWQSASNVLYDVEISTNGLDTFKSLLTNILATPPANRIQTPVQAGTHAFYRIRVSQ
ncbi:MAG: hypothetical protein ISS35_02515 [Kiritimatiellae bacterium]|nr:hypothetical protein [Kiritimatiellia bacterium]